jgi:hypothetical protein
MSLLSLYMICDSRYIDTSTLHTQHTMRKALLKMLTTNLHSNLANIGFLQTLDLNFNFTFLEEGVVARQVLGYLAERARKDLLQEPIFPLFATLSLLRVRNVSPSDLDDFLIEIFDD